MIPTLGQTNALFELSRCRPWWINPAPMTSPTKAQLAGRVAALVIVALFVIYCAAALVRALW